MLREEFCLVRAAERGMFLREKVRERQEKGRQGQVGKRQEAGVKEREREE